MKKSRHLTSISGSRNETLARLLRCLHLKMQVREPAALVFTNLHS